VTAWLVMPMCDCRRGTGRGCCVTQQSSTLPQKMGKQGFVFLEQVRWSRIDVGVFILGGWFRKDHGVTISRGVFQFFGFFWGGGSADQDDCDAAKSFAPERHRVGRWAGV